jgi:hypothetical protein
VPGRMGRLYWQDLCGRNHGTLTNMTPASSWLGFRPGGSGCLAFDGSNDYVAVGSTPPSLQMSGGITLSAWVYRTASAPANGIVTCCSAYSFASSPWAMLSYNSNILSVSYGQPADGINSALTIPLNEWAFCAVAMDPAINQVRYLVNGATEIKNVTLGTPNYSGRSVHIGSFVNNGGFWPGSIDDVRVTARAFSLTELRGLYDESRVGHPRTLNRVLKRGAVPSSGIILTPTAASAAWAGRTPGVSLGGLSVSPTAASASWAGRTPTITLGGLTIPVSPAVAQWLGLTPGVEGGADPSLLSRIHFPLRRWWW